MPFVENSAQRWYQFDIFNDEPGLVHGIFTRQGGVSPSPWSSLNMATSVGDDRMRVIENRNRILSSLQLRSAGFYDVWQVHGTNVVEVDHPRPLDVPHTKADSIISAKSNVAILMLFADCVPILIYDPIHRVIGMAHAGWKGTVDRIASATINAMHAAHGSHAADLLVGIGPSICVNHYQVGTDVIDNVTQSFGDASGLLSQHVDGKANLDLWNANQWTLIDCGVLPEHIQIAGLCTAEHPQHWYSHRGERGKTGRFGAVIAFDEDVSKS